jgi:Rnl2 family RNA ligase
MDRLDHRRFRARSARAGMTPYVPYPKVVDSLAAWNADEVERRALDKQVWVASEKLHGANLCIATDGTQLVVAKRRAVLDPTESFFAYKRAVAPLVTGVRRLFRELAPDGWAFIYGELLGGEYPHPDVAPIEGVHPVQSAIYYGPDVSFCAFDLATADASGNGTFVSYRRAVELFQSAGMPLAPILATGTLTELLALPVTFATRVPGQLGLPALPHNWAEGMVIKPWDAETPLAAPRRVVKRKRPEFAETIYHEARKWPTTAVAADALARAEAALWAMINANRVHSAISKLGRPEDVRLEQIVDEVMTDVRDELDRAHGELVLSLTRDEAALLWAVAHDDVIQLVTDIVSGPQPSMEPRPDPGALTGGGEPQPSIDPELYYADLAWAFLRGRLPDAGTGSALLATARAAGIRWHKFKRKSGPPRVTQVLSILEGLSPSSLLDIGSGRGAFLWPLVARFDTLAVTAVDRLEHRVRDIEAVRAGGVTRVRGALGDVTALAFPDDTFDLVTILEVLEHLEDPAAAAAETLRVASRFVIASVPSHPDDNPEHIRLFTKETLTALFEAAGATRVQISYTLNHMIAIVSV